MIVIHYVYIKDKAGVILNRFYFQQIPRKGTSPLFAHLFTNIVLFFSSYVSNHSGKSAFVRDYFNELYS